MDKPFGMIAAIATPMEDDGAINYDGLGELVEYLIDGGIHGILVGGSNGEYSLMTPQERRGVIEYVTEKVDKRVQVMAGTGCHRTKDTIELTQFASDAGADYALVITPYYMQTSDQGIIDHYRRVAETSDIGVVIYNYPDATGVGLSPELIRDISEIDNVVSIKNTDDGVHTSKLIALTKDNPDFSVLTGFEDMIVPALSIGAHGGIGVVHNLVPEKVVRLYDLIVKENNVQDATALNSQLLDLYHLLESETIPGTVKAGLEALNLPGGTSRLPLVPASDAYREKIKNLLNDIKAVKK